MNRGTRLAVPTAVPAAVLALAAMTGAGLAGAARFPEGCAPFLTVQATNCQAISVALCDAGNRAVVIRSQSYGTDGLSNIEETTEDWSLRYSAHPTGRPGLFVRDAPVDTVSRDVLLQDGVDTFDYPVTMRTPEGLSLDTRLTGALESLGGKDVIDGHKLETLRFRYTFGAGAPGIAFEADITAYYSAEFGVFFNGAGQMGFGGDLMANDETPVTFHEPGDEGFLDMVPRFNCDAEFAAYRPDTADFGTGDTDAGR